MIIVGIRSDRVMSRCKLKRLQAVVKIGAIKGSVSAALTRTGNVTCSLASLFSSFIQYIHLA